MAVFTPIERALLEHWLRAGAAGSLLDFSGIPAGIENTNYFVTTSTGQFVLTIFERLDAEHLPFYLELMRHLAQRGVACPAPLPSATGELFRTLASKPAALVSRLPGRSVTDPNADQCAMTGAALARLHLAARDFGMSQPNLRGLDWWLETTPSILPFLTAEQAGMLTNELGFQSEHYAPLASSLPYGPVHADLFRDNVLFDGNRLGGFIDFYFAACDIWLFDVAVSVNDWCTRESDGRPQPELADAFLAAYASERAFTSAEARAWPIVLRAAALRFWISRLADLFLPRPAEVLHPHDPARFERVLHAHRDSGGAGMPSLPL